MIYELSKLSKYLEKSGRLSSANDVDRLITKVAFIEAFMTPEQKEQLAAVNALIFKYFKMPPLKPLEAKGLKDKQEVIEDLISSTKDSMPTSLEDLRDNNLYFRLPDIGKVLAEKFYFNEDGTPREQSNFNLIIRKFYEVLGISTEEFENSEKASAERAITSPEMEAKEAPIQQSPQPATAQEPAAEKAQPAEVAKITEDPASPAIEVAVDNISALRRFRDKLSQTADNEVLKYTESHPMAIEAKKLLGRKRLSIFKGINKVRLMKMIDEAIREEEVGKKRKQFGKKRASNYIFEEATSANNRIEKIAGYLILSSAD